MADQLNATGISFGTGDGAAASSGNIIRMRTCMYAIMYVYMYVVCGTFSGMHWMHFVLYQPLARNQVCCC